MEDFEFGKGTVVYGGGEHEGEKIFAIDKSDIVREIGSTVTMEEMPWTESACFLIFTNKEAVDQLIESLTAFRDKFFINQ